MLLFDRVLCFVVSDLTVTQLFFQQNFSSTVNILSSTVNILSSTVNILSSTVNIHGSQAGGLIVISLKFHGRSEVQETIKGKRYLRTQTVPLNCYNLIY